MKVGLYARVSTQDQKTLPMQVQALRTYVRQRGWTLGLQIKDVGSGASDHPQREQLMQAARRRELDVILVWRLDRWGRSLADLVLTLKELSELGVGFVSLTEALDLTTPTGRALAGLLAVFAEFEREILREGSRQASPTHAKKDDHMDGRPRHGARQPGSSACMHEE
jgi:DNA invertase Pin-like site-specific DNA recombinase